MINKMVTIKKFKEWEFDKYDLIIFDDNDRVFHWDIKAKAKYENQKLALVEEQQEIINKKIKFLKAILKGDGKLMVDKNQVHLALKIVKQLKKDLFGG